MRRPSGTPGGTKPDEARRLGSAVRAAAVAALAFLASAPTPAGAEALSPALLSVSEILAAPAAPLAEAEGEWVELQVVAGGALAGMALTDFDGASDFTFPQATAEAGELLLVANGATRPAGAPPSARVFFALKSWWTFDNRGDDLAVLSAGGALVDHVQYGTGDAVDSPAVPSSSSVAGPGEIPAGASVGRVRDSVAALVPTPGGPNIALTSAGQATLRMAGAILQDDAVTVVACAVSSLPLQTYLWALEAGGKAAVLGASEVLPGQCVAVGAPLGPPLAAAVENALDLQLAPFALGASLSWSPGALLRLNDPWGSAAVNVSLPAPSAPDLKTATLITRCGCALGWATSALSPAPALGPARPASDVRVVRAGAALEQALANFFENVSQTLEVNAYLLTAASVLQSIRAAAERGVHVRLLLEGAPAGTPASSTALDPSTLAAFNASGVWARVFNTSGSSPARDHAKYAVADRVRLVVLTENFVGSALSDSDPNTGYAVFLRSRLLAADLGAVFEWDFAMSSDATQPRPAPQAEAPVAGDVGSSLAGLLLSPADSTAPWESLVENASATVLIESLSADLETLGPGSPLGSALLRAADIGVRVRVLLSGSYAKEGGDGTAAVARGLASAGRDRPGPFEVRVDERAHNASSKLHAKLLSVDGARFILGSHNLVRSAFAANREVSLLVEDAAAAAALEAMLDQDWAAARAVVASALSLSAGGTFGTDETPGAPTGPRPASFEALFAAGAVITAGAHAAQLRAWHRARSLRGWLKGRARERRRSASNAQRTPAGHALPAQERPIPEAEDARPAAFEIRARPAAPDGPPSWRDDPRLPPSALELFEER